MVACWSTALYGGVCDWQPWESKLTIVVIVATPKLSQIPTIWQFGKNIPKQVQAISLQYLAVTFARIVQKPEIHISPKLIMLSLDESILDFMIRGSRSAWLNWV